ncbi:MAG: ketopantoate reductase family protein [Rhodospirillales bacterium]|nr:ketopantoate reductase family protein [Rhodospirillales bacterium]
MRYVIYGTGAIGGIVGARLQAAGQQVVFIARGCTLDALRRDGLTLRTADERRTFKVDCVATPVEADISADDAVILAMKSQDTVGALGDLAACAPAGVPVFCAQNGVANERLALRHFSNVYGMFVYIFGLHLEPGVVQCYTSPSFGVLDLGRFPGGADEIGQRTTDHLAAAGFDTFGRSDIMRWKYGKLLANLANVLHAACGPNAAFNDILDQARSEGEACLRAAGIAYAGADERAQRIAAIQPLETIDGAPFPGGSSWQSLARGTGSIETDFLNGEIALLGRLHGVPTPVNEMLQALSRSLLQEKKRPASLSPDNVRSLLARGVQAAAAA